MPFFTNRMKYGVKNIGEVTRDKANLTMVERYGMNYSKTNEFKMNYKNNSIVNLGRIPLDHLLGLE